MYNYSEVEYINTETKIKIYCNKCKKYFWQTPHSHLNGCGCPYCKQSKGEIKIKEFLDLNNTLFHKR